MAKTGKGLPRSLKNVDFSDMDISVGWEEVTGKPAVIAAGETQAAARTAIGAGTPYTLPNASASVKGGVNQGAAVANVGSQTVSGADAAAVATSAQSAVNVVGTKLNDLLAQLRAAGIIAS